jgi:hypothetical protein
MELPLKISMIGPDGKRDNVERLMAVLSVLSEPGAIMDICIYHDSGCPCEKSGKPISFCTCDEVELGMPVKWNAL